MADRRQSTGDTVRELIDSGSFARTEARVRRRLEQRPDDAALLRRLGDLLRFQGKLDEAGCAYARLAELLPEDPVAARLAGLLRGRHAGALPALPTTFALVAAFLPAPELEALRELVRRHREDFAATPVKRDGASDALDTETRRSSSFAGLGELGRRLVARVETLLPSLMQRLGTPDFPASIRSCKVSVYHAGHFFRLHQDRTDGPAASRRFGFILYFDFPPRRFSGGELVLYDLDPETLLPTPSFTTVVPESNSLVVMPAGAWHEVLPIRCDSEDWFAGRFTLSGWIHDENHPAA